VSALSSNRNGRPVHLCFVCLGNICRSPMAEAVMHAMVQRAGLSRLVEVSSAGTAGWHVGDRPDQRAIAELARRGITMTSRGRQFHQRDFDEIDLVLCMDGDNRVTLLRLAPGPEDAAKVRLLRTFDPECADDVEIADPYYGTEKDFALACDLIEASCRGVLDHVRDKLL
jgi:protein-tyrosine phosphatase